MNPNKIIYIAGSGRSGSTITDILLSQGENIMGVGELINLFTNAWTNNEYCACGEKALDCYFWNKIKNKWEQESHFTIQEYALIQKKFTRIYSIPKIFWNTYFPSKEFKHFSDDTKLLYKNISEESRSTMLIDSSKSPYWLLTIRAMGIDIDVLHLVRDGRNVLKSKSKFLKLAPKAGVQKEIQPRSVLLVGIQWVIHNFMTELFRNKEKYICVRYEDLITTPISVLEKISIAFNLNLEEAQNKVDKELPLAKSHTIAGSRLRMKKTLRFVISKNKKENKKQKKRLRYSFKKSVFMIIIYPFLKKYNYL